MAEPTTQEGAVEGPQTLSDYQQLLNDATQDFAKGQNPDTEQQPEKGEDSAEEADAEVSTNVEPEQPTEEPVEATEATQDEPEERIELTKGELSAMQTKIEQLNEARRAVTAERSANLAQIAELQTQRDQFAALLESQVKPDAPYKIDPEQNAQAEGQFADAGYRDPKLAGRVVYLPTGAVYVGEASGKSLDEIAADSANWVTPEHAVTIVEDKQRQTAMAKTVDDLYHAQIDKAFEERAVEYSTMAKDLVQSILPGLPDARYERLARLTLKASLAELQASGLTKPQVVLGGSEVESVITNVLVENTKFLRETLALYSRDITATREEAQQRKPVTAKGQAAMPSAKSAKEMDAQEAKAEMDRIGREIDQSVAA